MVVYRKDTGKYYFKVKRICFSYERPFLHKIFPEVRINGLKQKRHE